LHDSPRFSLAFVLDSVMDDFIAPKIICLITLSGAQRNVVEGLVAQCASTPKTSFD
jgi:hypothetical protein